MKAAAFVSIAGPEDHHFYGDLSTDLAPAGLPRMVLERPAGRHPNRFTQFLAFNRAFRGIIGEQTAVLRYAFDSVFKANATLVVSAYRVERPSLQGKQGFLV